MAEIIIDENGTYLRSFKAYIKAHNLKHGDKCTSMHFMSWITKKHEEFRKKINKDRYSRYTEEQVILFLNFIDGEE